ncbi:Tetraspanin-8 [Dichanthelium oligosanthes]|uniref:Tetraspanin-8 n=1 Tax=Dichanthelium oligosanthes TaxID=888268 RepID=A0A1E5W3S7_9POAL|nr:Tetraspanin-8 [Dichanthelium oligosanthes]
MAAIRMSNNVIIAANLVTLLLSVPVLIAGVWLRSRADGAECDRLVSTPAIALGAALMATSLAGLVGACCRATWLIWLHLLAMLALLVALLCFAAFAFVVTSGRRGGGGAGEGEDTSSGAGIRVYRLGDYSTWLRRRVEGDKNWARIRSCLADAGVCKRLKGDNKKAQLVAGGMSPVESGCCRPPASCNFTYAGVGEWARPAGRVAPSASADPDCGKWDNDEDKLCYGCQSCKAAVVGALRRDWRRAAIVGVVFLAFILVVYSVGCCAFRNSRRDNYAYHSSRGWKRSGDA